MFRMDNIELEFSEPAIRRFAKKAIELKTGARGLRNILESSMLPLMYNCPSDKDITKIVLEEVDGEISPVFTRGTICEKTSGETNENKKCFLS